MIDLFTPYLMTGLLWKRLTTGKITSALSLIYNAVKDNSFGASGPCPPRDSSSPEAEAGDPARATLANAGRPVAAADQAPSNRISRVLFRRK